jgi:hypothetical protein
MESLQQSVTTFSLLFEQFWIHGRSSSTQRRSCDDCYSLSNNNASELPLGFSFLFAIDWLIDRLVTALNVTGTQWSPRSLLRSSR